MNVFIPVASSISSDEIADILLGETPSVGCFFEEPY